MGLPYLFAVPFIHGSISGCNHIKQRTYEEAPNNPISSFLLEAGRELGQHPLRAWITWK
jgi:hypothetical protein